jgi:histidyl-tRNA synthetase
LNSGDFLDEPDLSKEDDDKEQKNFQRAGRVSRRDKKYFDIVWSSIASQLGVTKAELVKNIQNKISEKGLRYDLTVPLARYVVQHQDKLAFPFKRFHIGPVWRADRPQKGRYQEFYQCDADVIGSSSLFNEVELTMIYAEVFKELDIPVVISLNSRKFLFALAEKCAVTEHFSDFTTILDKEDKIGIIGVENEFKSSPLFRDKRVAETYVSLYKEVSRIKKESFTNDFEYFCNSFFSDQPQVSGGGQSELQTVVNTALLLEDDIVRIQWTPALARGLNYYSGIIWEVVLDKNNSKTQGIAIGSLGGGGRYDNLTEMFGGQNMSGVGISFGIERIYDVMEELNLFPATIAQGAKVLFVPRDADVEEFTFQQVQTLRTAGIAAEIFLGNVKKQKQFAYAEQKGIPYMVEIGGNEMESKQFRLRNVTERKEEGNGWTIEQLVQKFI